MSLVPVDKAVDEIIARKARETGRSKAEILRMIFQKALQGSGEGLDMKSPTEVARALAEIPNAKPGTLADEIQDMAKSMFLMNMMKMMSQPQQTANSNPMGNIQQVFLLKELTKPSIYELMLMDKLSKGEQAPKWLETLAQEQKETRNMLKEILGAQKEEERFKNAVAPLVEQMTKDREALMKNQQAIMEYIAKGETAPPDTIEAYIANALKERLTEEALDAIDRGLFRKQEVVTPEGSFNWKAVLDRMLNIGEEIVKKMPRRAPPIQPIKTTSGQYVHPATGQVLSPQQVENLQRQQAMMMQAAAQAQAQQVAPQQNVAAAPATEEAEEAERQKKTEEAIDTFMKAEGPESEKETGTEQEEQPNEPTGNEEY